MRLPVASAVLGAALAASTLVAAPPAGAASDINIQPRVIEPRIVIKSGACRQIPVVAHYSSSGAVESLTVEMQVWRGGTNTGSASLHDGESGKNTGTVSGYHRYCPTEGLGTFHVGPSTIDWYDADHNHYTGASNQRRTFVARQASRFKNVTISGSGTARSFRARAQYFDVTTRRWTPLRQGRRVELWRRDSNGTWVYTKSARVGKSGAVKVKVKKRARTDYRVTLAHSSTTWGGSSRSVRK